MKKKQTKKIKKALATKPIIIESLQPARIQAISTLSLAILEVAKALNTPAVVVRNSNFVSTGDSIGLRIITRTEDAKQTLRR